MPENENDKFVRKLNVLETYNKFGMFAVRLSLKTRSYKSIINYATHRKL